MVINGASVVVIGGPVTRVYHKGELRNGTLSQFRWFSTGTDRSAVDALNRPGTVHEFAIPQDVLMRWEMEGKVQRYRDFDAVTGTINAELRFSPLVAEELIRYRVSP